MKKRTWSKGVILRYTLLQIPGFAAAVALVFLIKRWIVFPDCYVWIALGLWVLKDVALFPFVWHAYDWDDPGQTGSMVGKKGRVTRKLAPSGYVQIGGELWLAEAADPCLWVEEGEWITVEGSDGLKLLVRPAYPAE
ncbi:MAG: NfeD family protein [Deltaproteobacteria bacterium]|nr:NfeD family protein [Deltaproteobacteria bacterium]